MENNERIIELLEVLVKAQLAPIIKEELAQKKTQQLYNLTGSNKTVKQISTTIGMSVGTISGIWQKWETLGLIKKEGKSYKKII